jgi:hypothetical protein
MDEDNREPRRYFLYQLPRPDRTEEAEKIDCGPAEGAWTRPEKSCDSLSA